MEAFNVDAEHAAIAARLRELADQQPTGWSLARRDLVRELLGLHHSALVAVAGDWYEAHPRVTDPQLRALFRALWSGATHEEQLLATRLLARRPSAIEGLDWDAVWDWRGQVDSLPAADAYVVRVLGPWVLHDVAGRIGRARALLGGDDLLDRRLALVVTVWLNRGRPGSTHPDLTLEFVDAVLADREPIVLDAVSWALRALARSHREVVQRYLDDRPSLHEQVRGEVINWLETGTLRGDGLQRWRIPGGPAAER